MGILFVFVGSGRTHHIKHFVILALIIEQEKPHTQSPLWASHPPHSRRKFTKLLGHRASFPIVGFPPSLAGRFSFPLKGVFFFHCGRFSERGFFHCGHFSFSINYRHSTESIYGRASTRKPEKVGYLSFTLSYIQTHSLSLSVSHTHTYTHSRE